MDEVRELTERLEKAVEEYLAEIDNPAPDYAYRHLLRERMRKALALLRGLKEQEAR